jgi:hypothetical protein
MQSPFSRHTTRQLSIHTGSPFNPAARRARWALALAASAALTRLASAETLTLSGPDGLSGGLGENGTAAPPISYVLTLNAPPSADPDAILSVYGGTGGHGGSGHPPSPAGGHGGAGGTATAESYLWTNFLPNVQASSTAQGGAGGSGAYGMSGYANGNSGSPGDGIAFTRAESQLVGGYVSASSLALGGTNSWYSIGTLPVPGADAAATSDVRVPRGGGGTSSASAFGGSGASQIYPASGGNGGQATIELLGSPDALTSPGWRQITTSGSAYGGNGGFATGTGFTGGSGGTAYLLGMGHPTLAGGTLGDTQSNVSLQSGSGGGGWLGANGGDGAYTSLSFFGPAQGKSVLINRYTYGSAGGNAYDDNQFTPSNSVGAPGQAGGSMTFVDVDAPDADVSGMAHAVGGGGGSRYGTGDGAPGALAEATYRVNGSVSAAVSAFAQGGAGGRGGGYDPHTLTVYPGSGGDGGPALAIINRIVTSNGGAASASAYGGPGGEGNGPGQRGGAGGSPSIDLLDSFVGNRSLYGTLTGGPGGYGFELADGGHGGDAVQSVTLTVPALPGNVSLNRHSYGGSGGTSCGGTPGTGGNAQTSVSYTTTANVSLDISVSALGGTGGAGHAASSGTPSNGSLGGTALATVDANSAGPARAVVSVTGGHGGYGSDGSDAAPGLSPDPASYARATSGNASAEATFTATGGNGGDAYGLTGRAGDGAPAIVSDRATVALGNPAAAATVYQYAYGGFGGAANSGLVGAGGDAHSSLNVDLPAHNLNFFIEANAGSAGTSYAVLPVAAPASGGDAQVSGTAFGRADVSATGNSYAGNGADRGVSSGFGGNALSQISAVSLEPASNAYVNANSRGGAPGLPDEYRHGRSYAAGGNATSRAVAAAGLTSGYAQSTAAAYGGEISIWSSGGGESASPTSQFYGYDAYFPFCLSGGNGGAATSVADAESGSATYAYANAVGGHASPGIPPGRGGDADARANVTPLASGSATASAFATGGPPMDSGRGGSASARARVLNPAAYATRSADAVSSGGLLNNTASAALYRTSAGSALAVSETDEDPVLALSSVLYDNVGVYSKAIPSPEQAATHYAGKTLQTLTFGDGTGVLALGYAHVSADPTTILSTTTVDLSGNTVRRWGDHDLYVGIFNASGLTPSGFSLQVETLRDGSVFQSFTVTPLNGLVATLGDAVLPLHNPSLLDPAYSYALRLTLSGTGDARMAFVLGAAPLSNRWRGGAAAPDWDNPEHWTSRSVPNSPGALAVFDEHFVQPSPVLLTGPRTLGTLDLRGPGYGTWRYLGLGGQLVLDSGNLSVQARINANGADARFDIPVHFNSHTLVEPQPYSTVAFNAGTTGPGSLYVAGGGIVLVRSAPLDHAGLTVINPGGALVIDLDATLPDNGYVYNNSVGPGLGEYYAPSGLNLRGDSAPNRVIGSGSTHLDYQATLRLAGLPQPLGTAFPNRLFSQSALDIEWGAALKVVHTTTTPLGVRTHQPAVLDIGFLSMSHNGDTLDNRVYFGFIDLLDSDLILHDTPLDDVRSMIRNWYGNGFPIPTGLGSSLAVIGAGAHAYTTLAAVPNTDSFGLLRFATFDGLAVTATDTLVKYTYRGDTNLDGILDASDFNSVLSGITNALTGWDNGDLNYDGVADLNDWSLFLSAYTYYLASGTPLGSSSSPGAAVPEPASLALVATALPLLLRRRR